MKKRVVFVADQLSMGGIEAALTALLTHMDPAKYALELHVLQDTPLPFALPPYVRVYHAPFNALALSQPLRPALRRLWKHPLALWRRLRYSLLRRLRRGRLMLLAPEAFPGVRPGAIAADAVITCRENSAAVVYALYATSSRNILCFFHTEKNFAPDYTPLYADPRVRALLTVSEGNAAFLRARMSLGKIQVLHNLVDPASVRARAKEAPPEAIPDGPCLLVSVCRVAAEKGVGEMLAAAARIKAAGVPFRWWIVGPFASDAYEALCLARLREENLADCVRFCGPRANPLPYIGRADVVVSPSHKESFGMTVREAQILGVPVVAADTSGARELIEPGVTGEIVPVADVGALSTLLLRWIGDEAARARMREALRARDFDECAEILARLDAMVQGEPK